jgi:hypothetical protein
MSRGWPAPLLSAIHLAEAIHEETHHPQHRTPSNGTADTTVVVQRCQRGSHLVVAGSFGGLLGFVVGNKNGIVIQGHIPLPPESVEHGQQPSVFLVDARLDKIDDRDVVSRLTSSAETMTEHETERSFQHCLIGLLEASLFIEGKYLMGGRLASSPRFGKSAQSVSNLLFVA